MIVTVPNVRKGSMKSGQYTKIMSFLESIKRETKYWRNKKAI